MLRFLKNSKIARKRAFSLVMGLLFAIQAGSASAQTLSTSNKISAGAVCALLFLAVVWPDEEKAFVPPPPWFDGYCGKRYSLNDANNSVIYCHYGAKDAEQLIVETLKSGKKLAEVKFEAGPESCSGAMNSQQQAVCQDGYHHTAFLMKLLEFRKSGSVLSEISKQEPPSEQASLGHTIKTILRQFIGFRYED